MTRYWEDCPAEIREQPNCDTPDCCLKVCPWASETKCYCCTENEVGRAEMQRRWEATHEDPWTGPKFKVGQGHKWNARLSAAMAKIYDRELEENDDE